MISKELLSEVLNVKISKGACFKVEYINSIEIQYYDNDIFPENRKHINVYELAHKCKEWAYDNGCMVRTNYENTIDGKLCRVSIARVCKFN